MPLSWPDSVTEKVEYIALSHIDEVIGEWAGICPMGFSRLTFSVSQSSTPQSSSSLFRAQEEKQRRIDEAVRANPRIRCLLILSSVVLSSYNNENEQILNPQVYYYLFDREISVAYYS